MPEQQPFDTKLDQILLTYSTTTTRGRSEAKAAIKQLILSDIVDPFRNESEGKIYITRQLQGYVEPDDTLDKQRAIVEGQHSTRGDV